MFTPCLTAPCLHTCTYMHIHVHTYVYVHTVHTICTNTFVEEVLDTRCNVHSVYVCVVHVCTCIWCAYFALGVYSMHMYVWCGGVCEEGTHGACINVCGLAGGR